MSAGPGSGAASHPRPRPSRWWLAQLLALALSLGLHGMLAAPVAVRAWLARSLDTAGEEGVDEGPLGEAGGGEGAPAEAELVEPPAPVAVSLYAGPPKPPAPTAPPRTDAPAASAAAPEAPRRAARPASPPRSRKPYPGARIPSREGVAGHPPRGRRKPCEKLEEVRKVGERKWVVERAILDWYATHLRELDKQAGVAVYRDENGKKVGARLYLPRCSVLRQGGLRNGDVITSVNGRRVTSIPAAVATYLALRNDRVIKVEITGKNGKKRVHTYKLK